MEIQLLKSDIFPEDIQKLLRSLSLCGFFSHSLLVGSWIFPIYKETFNLHYALKTFDIDFAIDAAPRGPLKPIDLEKIFIDLGYVPVTDYMTGLRKYSKRGLEIEFLAHRKGNQDVDRAAVKQLNITATPLPFLNILFQFPLVAEFPDFKVQIPCPEALFIHKLIIAQRRNRVVKQENDLSQCRTLIPILIDEKLGRIIRSLKLGLKTRKAIITSCKRINFPPHKLGFK